MAEELLTGASPRATELLIEAWTAHADATDIVAGLAPEQAVAKHEGWPYSIAQLVAHMLFWWRHAHVAIETGEAADVASAAVSWPEVTAAEWPGLHSDYLAMLEKSRALTRDPDTFNRRYVEGRDFTVGVKLLTMVTHDSYHLGQVALLRRLMGAWPPPGGGDTW